MTASQPQELGTASPLSADERQHECDVALSQRLTLHWPIIAVLAAFLATLFFIPVMVRAPVSDDWVYARSVEILLTSGKLKIFDLAVVTLIFQIGWGGLFALVFGTTFGALRLSTIALMTISAVAFYGTCRELKLSRGRSAVGTAAYLFNPLSFALAFSFMTDPQFLALLVIASYFYVRGLRVEAIDRRIIIFGSAAASCAFLVRQQGALIPLAVGVYLVLSRRWKPDLGGLKMALWVAGLPALTLILYYIWLFNTGAPAQQNAFLNQMTGAGWASTRLLFERMTFIEVMYIGFFAAPVVLALIPGALRWRLPRTWVGMAVFVACVAILITGLQIFGMQGRVMPYLPQFVGSTGIGPTDLIGGRPRVIPETWLSPLTIAFAVSVFLFFLLTTSQTGEGSRAERAGPGLLVSLGLFQVLGIMPPSFHFRNWIISVDRYLVPILPFALLLLLWSTRKLPMIKPLAWLAIALYAFFSIAGTRDFLVFQGATWTMARQAVEMGVPLTRLDAGSSWDGYHLYEYTYDHRIYKQHTPGGPWWTNLFAKATDSTYIVSTQPLQGYDVIAQREYSSWLHNNPQMIYPSRKHTFPGPP
jgi:hypothetical protein